MTNPTAAILIIGNEILSGRTQDKNLAYLAEALNNVGVKLVEARVVPDIEQEIIDAVQTLSAKATYVFTSGGIGPTHDDITSAAVANAFGVPLIRHPEGVRLLEQHYANSPNDLNEARLKMADVPEGASLIDNPVSKAPGFKIGNVHVMAGVPRIMQAMVDNIIPTLTEGAKTHSVSVSSGIKEGDAAAALGALQDQYPNVDLGSYPYHRNGAFGTSLVARSTDTDILAEVEKALIQLVKDMGEEPLADRPEGENAYA